QSQYDIHERPAEHHQKFLPSRTEFVKFRFRHSFAGRIAAFERGGHVITVKFYVCSERNCRNSIIGVAAFEAPNSRAEAEERICLDTHPEKFGDDKMAELMDIDRNTENKNNG